jgi:ABC-type nitrate/sulfonate/bicarbonate transport system substrate-binding protein
MKLRRGFWLFCAMLFVSYCFALTAVSAQEKIRLAHSALESSNSVWYLAQDRGFYKKHGLDVGFTVYPEHDY